MESFLKFLIIMLIVISCSSTNKVKENTKLNEPLKYQYLQSFYKLKQQLQSKSIDCKEYIDEHISSKIKYSKINGQFEFQFADSTNIIQTLASYNPEKFDWYEVNNAKNLFLKYPYDSDIFHEHLEISNNIRDCSAEFENFNFLSTTIKYLSNKNISKPEKVEAKKVFFRYLDYIEKQEVSILNILLTTKILLNLEDHNLLQFQNKIDFITKTKELEVLYTKASKSALLMVRNNEKQATYIAYQQLRLKKELFKKYMYGSFRLF